MIRSPVKTSALLIVVLVAGACSSTAKRTSVGTGATSPDASVAPDLTQSPDAQAPAGSTPKPGSRAAKRSSAKAPGVGGSATAANVVPVDGSPLKIGVVIPVGNPGAFAGVDYSSDSAQTRKNLQALADVVNERGGFAGRKIELAIAEVDNTDDGEATQVRRHNEACLHLTEDAKSFLVFSDHNTIFYAADCYAQHKTPLLGNLLGSEEQSRARAPWILPPLYLTPERMARLQAHGLAEQGFLTQRMAVIALDIPTWKNSVQRYLIPGITERGGKVIDTFWARREYQDVATGIASAVLRFQQQGVDRIVTFLPSAAAVWVLFTRQAENQGYRPRYGVSSFDAPALMLDTGIMPKEQMHGTVGVGFNQVTDVNLAAQPPLSEKEKRCLAIANQRAGVNYQNRSRAADGFMNACDDFFLMQKALASKTGKPLLRDQLVNDVAALGTTFEPVRFERARFTGTQGGIVVYAHIIYDQACGCFKYSTPWKDIPF